MLIVKKSTDCIYSNKDKKKCIDIIHNTTVSTRLLYYIE